ncbi:hypothetical protein [Alloyangia pacifica]|uniref:Uncharacterized protein n=1 Tax=Alloyangia pacifica TaxID=311180 RepID=A0A1I6UNU4_9RHOB|nr:hypothetical protein [Alloyangia pacifica]SDH76869.1 hypothetical protein SAMN04488245_109219 [Alloyangia pacifica]SFT03136.1 hypothetical protein SAMN04488050_108219 [Alloyangia pacifica]
MLTFLRIGVSALALSTFVVAPIVTVVTADQAYAKSDKAGGNGNGGGKGGGNGGGNGGGKGGGNSGKSDSDRGNSGKGGGKSASARSSGGNSSQGNKGGKALGRAIQEDFTSLGRSLKSGIGGLFGGAEKPKETRKAKATAATRTVSVSPKQKAPEVSVRPPASRPGKVKDTLHASALGKLNGALHSSPRAKEAHIANGNYATGKGPVSLAAALAVADYLASDAATARAAYADAVVAAEETLALAEAFSLVENKPTEDEVLAAQAVLDDPEATEEAKAAAQEVLDYPDTTEAQAQIEGQVQPTEEQLAEAQAVIDGGAPSEQDFAIAEQSVAEAEAALLDSARGALSEEEAAALLEAIRAANPDPEAVAAALEEQAAREAEVSDETFEEDDLADGTDDAEEDGEEDAAEGEAVVEEQAASL